MGTKTSVRTKLTHCLQHYLTIILETLSAGFEPATSTLGGSHSIQTELREHKETKKFYYKKLMREGEFSHQATYWVKPCVSNLK